MQANRWLTRVAGVARHFVGNFFQPGQGFLPANPCVSEMRPTQSA